MKISFLPLTTIFFTALLSGCSESDSEQLPPYTKLNFISSCLASGGNNQACECSYKKLMRAYSPAEFMAADKKIASGDKIVLKQLLNITKDCK